MRAEAFEHLICKYLQRELKCRIDEIDVNRDLDELGLDSAAMIDMVGELEEKSGLELEPTLAYDFPTPKLLAEALAHLSADARIAANHD